MLELFKLIGQFLYWFVVAAVLTVIAFPVMVCIAMFAIVGLLEEICNDH